jgi:hypothetical protein
MSFDGMKTRQTSHLSKDFNLGPRYEPYKPQDSQDNGNQDRVDGPDRYYTQRGQD